MNVGSQEQQSHHCQNRAVEAVSYTHLIAREHTELEDLISRSYPYVMDHEKISECIEKIKDYAEDSIPVLLEDRSIGGIITTQDIVEIVDDEMGDDYAKLAGLTAEEDLNETTRESIRKRLPWLVILLFLGMVVSAVVGVFESVVAVLPIVMCFQSLILDMAGNVGTQSLAVTIRAVSYTHLHVNRNERLMEEGYELLRRGGYVDLTCGMHTSPGKCVLEARKRGIPTEHMTMSSDGHGSWSDREALPPAASQAPLPYSSVPYTGRPHWIRQFPAGSRPCLLYTSTPLSKRPSTLWSFLSCMIGFKVISLSCI